MKQVRRMISRLRIALFGDSRTAYRDPGRIVMFQNVFPAGRSGSASPTEFNWWRQQIQAFQNVSAYDFNVANLTGETFPEQWIGKTRATVCDRHPQDGNSLEIPGRGSTHTQSGYNVGGGVNFWLQKKAALRFEVRHQSSVWYKSMDVRMGVTFR